MKKIFILFLVLILSLTGCNRYEKKIKDKPTDPVVESDISTEPTERAILENTATLEYNKDENTVNFGDINLKFKVPTGYRLLEDEEMLKALKNGNGAFGENASETDKELYLKMTSMFIDDETTDSIQLVLDNSLEDITIDELSSIVSESFANVASTEISVVNTTVKEIPAKTLSYKVTLEDMTLYYSYIILVKDGHALAATFTSENEINIADYLSNFTE